MAIIVEHRKDGLLERTASNDVPFDLRHTTVGQYTWPIYRALYWFLTDRIMEQEFESPESLQAALNGWTDFANENGMSVIADYPLFIDEKGTAVRFPEMGGWASEGMIVAIIREVEAQPPSST